MRNDDKPYSKPAADMLDELIGEFEANADEFWDRQARRYLTWFRGLQSVSRPLDSESEVAYFSGGVLNAAYNALDRHLKDRGAEVAFYLIENDHSQLESFTYLELLRLSCKMAALLVDLGIKKGDCVALHCPDKIESVAAVLACARIGAVYVPVPTGFGPGRLASIVDRCEAKLFIVAAYDSNLRLYVDHVEQTCKSLRNIVMLSGENFPRETKKVVRFDERGWADSDYIPPVEMGAEDPLFIMFASPAIGEPRPIVHSHGGFLLWAAMVADVVFKRPREAPIWPAVGLSEITGHSLGLYGTLLNGRSGLLCPFTPRQAGFHRVIAKAGVSNLLAGATQIRMLAENSGRSALCADHLKNVVVCDDLLSENELEKIAERFDQKCLISNVWGQDETGGPIFVGYSSTESDAAMRAFVGIMPSLLDLSTGEATSFPNQEGALFITRPWPSVVRDVYRDHDTYTESYYRPFSRMFNTGTSAKHTQNGRYSILTRIDDVIMSGGNRIGSWEVEAVLTSHIAVIETAVVGFPHRLKGAGIYAFIRLDPSFVPDDALKDELIELIRFQIGEIAVPDVVQWTREFPKTRGGKTLRRVLQRIAAGIDIGDVSTVSDPSVITALLEDRFKLTA